MIEIKKLSRRGAEVSERLMFSNEVLRIEFDKNVRKNEMFCACCCGNTVDLELHLSIEINYKDISKNRFLRSISFCNNCYDELMVGAYLNDFQTRIIQELKYSFSVQNDIVPFIIRGEFRYDHGERDYCQTCLTKKKFKLTEFVIDIEAMDGMSVHHKVCRECYNEIGKGIIKFFSPLEDIEKEEEKDNE